ncbi:L-lactate dehydrogenase [Paenibacillus hunanensis]|uniref:L-lactate dehydrogenase n=1 Tax=Paenibacillus hunanensis TaxID=539262 RepID=A0ABU1IY05_9BACL|nr:L-lactate dehydrogenase [Paenibacillus hunanensis]MCL9660857.1 L-lactate dehydrogenase [Paenibacillus hunanensis]MDR6244054.1 L-lactate dehydrogenase [Paenibacillus hunanensis]GGJ14954.1 L-lactate dehydrogenase 3 [Paenibacillus hunanensis]
MGRKNRKVAIVGVGMVGAGCAYSMINQSIADEIMMVGRTHEKAVAQALDLSHCMDFTSHRTKVYAGSLEDCGDMDIVIITAGANPKPGQDRMTVLHEAAAITKDIIDPIMASGFDGVFIIAANPVDVVTYLTWQFSGLPRGRVIGTGTSIDSSRLKTILSDVFSIDPRSVHGYVLGEHGESQFVAWSHVTIGGKPLLHILEQHAERFPELSMEDVALKTRDAGWEIFLRKGHTQFGIGNALAHIARSILYDEHRIIAVSAILDGEYGQQDVCTGVPAIISGNGIEELIELRLNEEEQKQLEHSCTVIRTAIEQVQVTV